MISRPALVATLLLACACGPANGAAQDAANAGGNAAAPAQSASPGDIAAAGHYRMNVGHDSASELELLPNGRFQFFLAAGALSLIAEGRWTSDGHSVTLNTEPRPVPAAFAAGPVAHGRGHWASR